MLSARPYATLLRVALLALSLLLPVAALELYLRLFAPVAFRAPPAPVPGDVWREVLHVRSPIPGLAYELAPNHNTIGTGVRIATNAHGMRSYALMSRHPHVTRIAVVGDSYTFGFGVSMHRTFVAKLEQKLNLAEEPHWQYEVLNLGVGGYSTRDEALVVEHKALPLDPDLILVAYTLNDPEDDPVQPVHAHYQETAWWQHSHVLRLGAGAFLQWQIRHHGRGLYVRYLHQNPGKWASVQRAFERIARVAGEAEVPVALVIFPHNTVARWDAYPYRATHAQVAAAARAAGFLVLDLLPAFERHEPRLLRLSAADDHPSVRGHDIAAEQIHAWLRGGLLPLEERPLPPHARPDLPPFLQGAPPLPIQVPSANVATSR